MLLEVNIRTESRHGTLNLALRHILNPELCLKILFADAGDVRGDRPVDEFAPPTLLCDTIKKLDSFFGQGDVDALVHECSSLHRVLLYTLEVCIASPGQAAFAQRVEGGARSGMAPTG